MERADLVVENGTVVTGSAMVAADLAISDGRFSAIVAPGALRGHAAEVYDATGQYVLPGVIDGHVHFREPGLEHKEDFRSGSRAAVMGGVTTVLDMPNTLPPTSTAEHVQAKGRLAEAAYCDVGLFGLVAQDNLDQLAPMARAGIVGYKCFLAETVGSIGAPDDGVLLDALSTAAGLGLRMGFHAENSAILRHRGGQLRAAGRTDPLAHLDARPAIAEAEAIQRVALFARQTGASIHIVHLSSSDGLAMVDAWRARGVRLTAETSATYCFLSSDDMRAHGSMLRINPPVRAPGHGEALLQGLVDGRIDCIASDHSPHTLAEKQAADIWQAVSGFAGVETSVPLFLTYAVATGRMSLPRYVRASAEGPARAWGLYPGKGAIQVGSDGDLTIVDLTRTGVVAAARLHGKNNHTPFEGRPTTGAPVATIVRGQIVMRDGELVGRPRGRLVRPVPSGRSA